MSEDTATGQDQPTEAPAPEGQAQSDEQTQVQPDAGSPDPSQSSQGLIEPYLESVDPLLRDKVAPVLEKFRADQDARVNQRIEQANAKVRQYEQYGDADRVATATQILDSFIADPVATTQWLMDRGESELGVDIRSALSEAKAEVQQEAVETGSEPEAITPEKILEILDERDQRKEQEQQRQSQVEQNQQAAIQRASSWFTESLERHSIPTDALNDGLKEAMFNRANSLAQQGLADSGQTAIDMAVAEFGEAFSRVRGTGSEPPKQPKVAQGGTAPPAEEFNVSDDKSRREAMYTRLAALTGASD